jgi:hypothetical protein
MKSANWITKTEAARILEVSTKDVEKLEAQGLLIVRDIEGVRTRYNRESVEALAASWVEDLKTDFDVEDDEEFEPEPETADAPESVEAD